MKKGVYMLGLKRVLFSAIFIFAFITSNSQSFLISFPNNPEDITACYSSSKLTVRLDAVVNTSTGADVFINLPSGVEYVPNSISVINSTPGLSIMENGGTASSPVFKITPNVINLADFIIFTIDRKADCNAYQQDLSSIVFKDNVKTIINSVSQSADSPAYNILSPSLSLTQPVAQSNAIINGVYTRNFSITNGSEGNTDQVYFSIEYVNAGIQLQSLSLNGNILTPTSVSGNIANYTVNGTLLGADQILSNGEILTFTETYKVLKCNPVTNYSAGWGCSAAPSEWCQTSTGEGIVTTVDGVPALNSLTTQLVGYTDMCNPYVMRTTYTVGGTGDPAASAMYDVKLRIGRYYYNYVLNTIFQNVNMSDAKVRNNATGTLSATVPFTFDSYYTYNLNNFFTTDPDGPGVGLEDLDGDGYYDDIPAGKSVTLDISVSFNCVPTSCGVPNSSNSTWGFGGVILYHTYCDKTIYETTFPKPASGFRGALVRVSETANGNIPANISPGVPFNVRGSFGYYENVNDWRTSQSRYVYEFTLPAGSVVSNVKWAQGMYPSGTLATISSWTQVGNVFTVTAPNNAVGWTTFDVTYDCTSGSDYQITYKVLDRNSPTCDCVQEFVCGTLSAVSDCDACLAGPQIKVLKVERADNSLGWTNSTLATRQSRSNISAYDLSKALYLDEIWIQGDATQHGSASNLYLKMDLAKASGNVSKLTPIDIFVQIYRAGILISSGTITTYSNAGSTTTMQNIIWNLTGVLPVGGLLDNDEIKTKSRYQVATNNLPQHDVQSGNSYWFYNIDSGGVQTGCKPKIPEMYLVGLRQIDGHNQSLAYGCAVASLGGNYHHIATRFDPAGTNYRNEFRPGGYLAKYEITLSDAYSLTNSGNIAISETGVGSYTMTPSSIVGNTYTYINTGAWPAYNLTIENTYGLYISPRFQPNCAADGSTERITGKATIKDFYYHYADPTVTTWDKVYTWDPVPNFQSSPGIEISDETGTIQAVKTVETWRIKLFNPTDFQAPYTWIAIPNVTGVNIVNLIDETTGNPVVGIPYSGTGGSGIMYHLSTTGLAGGAAQYYKINFTYNACDESDVEILAGWNCTEFLDDPYGQACGPKDSVLLHFISQIAEIEVNAISQPDAPVDLCNPTHFEYQVNSAQSGNVIHSKFSVYTTSGMMPVSGSFQAEYPVGSGNWEVIPFIVSGNEYIYDLTAHSAYPVNGLPGTLSDNGDPNNRVIAVRFDINTDCDFVSGSNFEVSASGDMSCNQPAIGSGTRLQTTPIYINGITTDYYMVGSLQVESSSTGNFSTCGLPVTLRANHTYISSGATSNNTGFVEIRLPVGYEYITGSFNCISSPWCPTFDSTYINSGGEEVIKLLIPSGMSSGNNFSYTFDILENLTNPLACGNEIIKLVSLDAINNVSCPSAPGGSCPSILVETGSYDYNITIQKAILNLVYNSDFSVVNGMNENVTVNFTTQNTSTTSEAPAGIIVKAVYDANNNGVYDLSDVVISSTSLANSIAPSGSITQNFTFTATPQQVCNLMLVALQDDNPCTCNTDLTLIIPPVILTNIAGPDQTICANSSIALGLANNPSYTYTWNGANSTETAYLNNSHIAQPTFTYSGVPFTSNTNFTYTLTVTRPNGCSSSDTVVVTVKPAPIGTNATQTICSGSTLAHNLSSDVNMSGSTFTWSAASNANITGETTTTQTTSSITDTLINTTNTVQTVIYTITPTGSNGCPGNSFTYTVTVNPTAQVNQPSNQVVCNGSPTTAVTFTTANTGGTTTYAWTNDTTSIGLAASGTGNIASFTATNITTAPVTATITVTPSYANGGTTCTGSNKTFTITVNPTPLGTDISFTICSGSNVNHDLNEDTTLTGNTYSWHAISNSNVSGETVGNQYTSFINDVLVNTTSTDQTVIYIITPISSLGCAGNAYIVNVIVNPQPVGVNKSQTICSGMTLAYVLSNSITNGQTTGTTYIWSAIDNPNVSGESIIPQYEDTIDDTLINVSGINQVVVYTVIPTSANGCKGSPFTFTATVKSEPLGQNSIEKICSDDGLNYDLSSAITNGQTSGITYQWSAIDNPDVTGESMGVQTSDHIYDVLINISDIEQTVVYSITPTGSNGCTGVPFTYTVTVSPEPVGINDAETICSGTTLIYDLDTDTTLDGNTYQWYATANPNVSGESTSKQTSTVITDTLVNISGVSQDVVYTVIPTAAAGCVGDPFTVTITVYPSPNGNNQNTIICSDETVYYDLSTLVNTASNFTWYADDNTNVSGETTTPQNTSEINDVLNNITLSNQIVVYHVFPNSSAGCSGAPFTITVVIRPEPVGTDTTLTTCSGVAINHNLNNDTTLSGNTYSWIATDNPNVSGETLTTQSTNFISDTLENLSGVVQSVVYMVTPNSSNGCTGNSFTVTVIVNPEPLGISVADTYCSGITLDYDLTTLVNIQGTTFMWIAGSNPQVTGETTTLTSSSTIIDTLINISGNTQTIVYTILPTSGSGCAGNPFNITVTLDSEPVGTNATETICSGATLSHDLTVDTTMSGNTYVWIALDNALVTGESLTSQSSSILSDTLVNTSGSDQEVVYTVTPTSSAGCEGASFTVTVTVYPEVIMNPVANQELCNGFDTEAITFSANLSGATFYWENDTPSIGLSTNGVGVIPSFTAVNTTHDVVVAHISVYASLNGCVSDNIENFSITVNPTPEIPTGASEQTFCEEIRADVGDLQAEIVFGDSIVWYNTATGGTPLSLDELLLNGFYYAEGMYNTTGCVSNSRLEVEVIIDENCEFLSLEKTADVLEVDAAGDIITYTFAVGNINHYPLQFVAVTDPLISTITYVSGDTNSNQLLDTDENWIYTGTLVVTQPMMDHCGIDATGNFDGDGDIDNTATANAETLANVAVPSVSDDEYVLIDYLNQNMPSYAVTKTADKIEVREVGEVIYYTITVTNTATYALANVVVDDPLLDNEQYVSGDTNANNLLDLDEVWVYTGSYLCTQEVLQGFGVDPNGIIDDDGTIDNTVTVYADTPCGTALGSVSDSVAVTVKYIFIPQGFSPDGDNYNDTFEISGIELIYPNFILEIYNRWGNIVYEYHNEGRVNPIWWDGVSTGRATVIKNNGVPEGTYYYVLDPNNGVDKPIVNWVFVNRKN